MKGEDIELILFRQMELVVNWLTVLGRLEKEEFWKNNTTWSRSMYKC